MQYKLQNHPVDRAGKAVVLCLSLGVSLCLLAPKATCAPEEKKQQPVKNLDLSRLSVKDREDILLVMPNAHADCDELSSVLTENRGTVIGQLGRGELTVLLVKVPRGTAAQVEKKLQADKAHFNFVNANRRERACAYIPKDPGYSAPGAWHFTRMNLPDAWEYLDKNYTFPTQGIIVMDTGCDARDVNRDSQGCNVAGEGKSIGAALKAALRFSDVEDQEKNIIRLGNMVRTLTYTFQDNQGHGTNVCSAAAGSANDQQSIGVNPRAHISPVQIADGPYGDENTKADDLSVIAGMMCAFDIANAPVNNTRIINISYANMWSASKHPILHELFKVWYYKKDGLIFVSAGNEGAYDDGPELPYVNVVSALGAVKGIELANVKGANPWKSNFGPCVDFAAPGQNIPTADSRGMFVWFGGTSAASPIVAGVASLCLSVNPKLHNYQVEDILRRSAAKNNVPAGGRNIKFGWGMPDAYKAITLAKGTR